MKMSQKEEGPGLRRGGRGAGARIAEKEEAGEPSGQTGGWSDPAQTVGQPRCLPTLLPQPHDEGGGDASRGSLWGAKGRAAAMGPLVPKKVGPRPSEPPRDCAHRACKYLLNSEPTTA